MSATNLKMNFALFAQLFDDYTHLPENARSDVPDVPALYFARQSESSEGLDVVLAHYVERSGLRIADPEMVLRVRISNRTLEALSFRDAAGHYEVHPMTSGFDAREFVTQNDFLNTWLRKCVADGHRFAAQPES
jgi:hypothetical protein